MIYGFFEFRAQRRQDDVYTALSNFLCPRFLQTNAASFFTIKIPNRLLLLLLPFERNCDLSYRFWVFQTVSNDLDNLW